MSLKALTIVYEAEGLTPTEKLVLLCVTIHTIKSEGRWPSQSHIARKCGCDRVTVNRAISSLRRKGFGLFCPPKQEPSKKNTDGIRVRLNQTTRRNVYRKFAGECQYCGRDIDPFEFTVDHIVPLQKGGSNNETNLTLSCKHCNSSKGCRL